ncbi:GGDEF domain-containing protein [uncultured Salinisphaera sp.]|uniref:GGDEF domain-containing protein n=1 Tax=uncultured Salinisphaera sp. TaxID=359372 RepID=UPI0032B15B8D
MNIDIETLYLASVISRAAFLVVFTTTVLSLPSERYLRHWWAALVASTAGMLLNISQAEALQNPNHPLTVLTITLLLCSLLFSWSGLRVFYEHRLHPRPLLRTFALLVCAPVMTPLIGIPSHYVQAGYYASAALILLLFLKRLVPRLDRQLFAPYVIGLAVLMYFLALVPPIFQLLFTQNPLTPLAYSGPVMLVDQVACVLVYFGFIAMAAERANLNLRLQAETDPLTGLANRRGVVNAQRRQRRDAARGAQSSVLLADIDYFKIINDRLGHDGGDTVLRTFAKRLGQTIRTSDSAIRWGGEEFLVILPRTGPDEAEALAQRLREQTEAQPFAVGDQSLQVTVSIGVATTQTEDADYEAAINRADQALYRAKGDGRNRVCRFEAAASANAEQPGHEPTPKDT